MSNPMTLEQMQAIGKLLLNHPSHGLLANTPESDITTRNLLKQLESFLECPERISRDDWSALKSSSLLEVGDAAADCLSRICSAFRSPDVALSCFRDAAEKLADLNAERAKKSTLEQLRYHFKKNLLIESMMSNAKH